MRKLKLFAFLFSLGLMGGCLVLSGCSKGGDEKTTAAQTAKFHCPMHPTYTSDKPGDCPICGMRLVPIESPQEHEKAVAGVEESSGTLGGHEGHQVAVSTAPVSGQASVSIPVSRAQSIGVRVEPVAVRDLASVIRASARVAYDPELYSAMTEYKQAVDTKRKISQSPWPDVHERSDAMIRASGLRLRQLGLSEKQISRLATTKGDSTSLLLGEPGGSVWVYAQIYEYELARVKEGQSAEITSSAFSGRVFPGTVRSVSAVLNPETRSVRVLIDVPDPEGLLRPEMYVDAAIQIPLGRKIAIPSEAILDTGTRKLVFVESAPGKFDPREVQVGPLAGGFRPVLSGLKEGEMVVVSGNFLIDSESKLQAAASQPGGHKH